MKQKLFSAAVSLLLVSFASQAHAGSYQFSFAGSGVNGKLDLTYGPGTDAKYPQAYEVTAIAGTFTDTNLGIVDASVTGLVPINPAMPEPDNKLAPADFSHFDVASGLAHGFLSYDDLFYPNGSPQTASTYPPHGGFVDIYGLLFGIGNGQVVNFWSNGIFPGDPSANYGVAVVTKDTALDYVGNVATTPEPGSVLLLATGLLGLLAWRRPSLFRTSF